MEIITNNSEMQPHPTMSTDCWIWRKSLRGQGYGNATYQGAYHRAHVLSYKLFNNDYDLQGYTINHHCDRPACVNPLHLYKGTQAENNRDTRMRGRTRRVEIISDEGYFETISEACRYYNRSADWVRLRAKRNPRWLMLVNGYEVRE